MCNVLLLIVFMFSSTSFSRTPSQCPVHLVPRVLRGPVDPQETTVEMEEMYVFYSILILEQLFVKSFNLLCLYMRVSYY